jgi:hypothetical protein
MKPNAVQKETQVGLRELSANLRGCVEFTAAAKPEVLKCGLIVCNTGVYRERSQ